MTRIATLRSDPAALFLVERHLELTPDHLDVNNHTGIDRSRPLSLEDMAVPDIARGNCYAATFALLFHLHCTALIERDLRGTLHEATVHFGPVGADIRRVPRHRAAAVSFGGDTVVIDHTYRQFVPSAPVPLVLFHADWLDAVTRDGERTFARPLAGASLERYR